MLTVYSDDKITNLRGMAAGGALMIGEIGCRCKSSKHIFHFRNLSVAFILPQGVAGITTLVVDHGTTIKPKWRLRQVENQAVATSLKLCWKRHVEITLQASVETIEVKSWVEHAKQVDICY
jgi:hypothetical protein